MAKKFSLAVNTSQTQAEIFLFKDSTTFFSRKWVKEKSHSEVITSEFLKLTNHANIQSSDIDKIYCVVGPGSFTGVRVGVSFCKTLAYSLSLPLISINGLDLLATSCHEAKGQIVSVIDAQKNSVFLSLYNLSEKSKTKIHENKVVLIADLGQFVKQKVFVCGTGLGRYDSLIPDRIRPLLLTKTEWASPELENWFVSNRFNFPEEDLNWETLRPLYIKASAPEEKIKNRNDI